MARRGAHTARGITYYVVSGGGVAWHCQNLANLSSLTDWHEPPLWAWARLEAKHASTAITALMVTSYI